MNDMSLIDAVKILNSLPYDSLMAHCRTDHHHQTFLNIRLRYQLIGRYFHYLTTPQLAIPADLFPAEHSKEILLECDYWWAVYSLIKSAWNHIKIFDPEGSPMALFNRIINQQAVLEFYFQAMPEKINGGNYFEKYSPNKTRKIIRDNEDVYSKVFTSKGYEQKAGFKQKAVDVQKRLNSILDYSSGILFLMVCSEVCKHENPLIAHHLPIRFG